MTDLNGRHEVESTVEAALRRHPRIELTSVRTDSFAELDFELAIGQLQVPLELKAKHQRYQGWGRLAPSIQGVDLFLLDELALRKLIGAGRHAHLLIRDAVGRRWVLIGVPELVLSGKVRANRVLHRRTNRVKAKLLLDLSIGEQAETLDGALDMLVDRLRWFDRRWSAIEPWPIRTDTRKEAS